MEKQNVICVRMFYHVHVLYQDFLNGMRTNEFFLKNKLVSMALFLSSNIHQGDERFSVHSRGKQCAFMTLSAILTA